MLKLFSRPLRQQNTKVGTSELVNEPISELEHQNAMSNGVSKTSLLDQLKRSTQQSPPGPTPKATTATAASTRSSRTTRSGPIYDFDDTPDVPKVFKYSVEVGLGTPWTKWVSTLWCLIVANKLKVSRIRARTSTRDSAL